MAPSEIISKVRYFVLPERGVTVHSGDMELDYPFHDRTVTVTTSGRICFNRRKINLSAVFADQNVDIKQVTERIWLVMSFRRQ